MKSFATEFIDISNKDEPLKIAVLTTTRIAQVKLIIQKLKSLFPSASFYLVTQTGRSADLAKIFPEADIVEALPSGIFKLWKTLMIKFRTVRELKSDILVVAYSSPNGEGYYALDLLATFLGAKKTLGISCVEYANYPEVAFCDITLGRLLPLTAVRIAMIPVEIALIVVVSIMFLLAEFYRLINKSAGKDSA